MLLSPRFAELGLEIVPGPHDVQGTGQFWKWTEGRLRLILGVDYHRFYEETFSAAFYLGRTFTYSLHTASYPRQTGFRRIGELVPELPSRDHWWHGLNQANANELAGLIPTFERRFIDQPGLEKAVAADPELLRREALVRRIGEVAASMGDAPATEGSPVAGASYSGRYAQVPRKWFLSAEVVLRRDGTQDELGAGHHKILSLGLDAWRCAVTSPT